MAIPVPGPPRVLHATNVVRRHHAGIVVYLATCGCGWRRPGVIGRQVAAAAIEHRRASRFGEVRRAIVATKSDGPSLAGRPVAPRKTFRGGPGGCHQRRA